MKARHGLWVLTPIGFFCQSPPPSLSQGTRRSGGVMDDVSHASITSPGG